MFAHPEWLDDPRFATATERLVNREDLIGEMEAVTRTEPVAHWLERLHEAGVPAGL